MPDNLSPYDDFPALSPDERKEREDELFGDKDPGQATRIREARSWAALFDAAREKPTAEETLVRSYLFDEGPPENVDPEAVTILQELQRHADPVELFERLRNPDATVEAPATRKKDALKRRRRASRMPFSGWSSQTYSWGQYAFATFLVLFAVYGGLFVVSQSTLPDHSRIADVSEVGDSFRPPRVRGPERTSLADQYEAATIQLDASRKSFFGLFPSYDAEQLDEAAEAFKAIREETEPLGAYRQEATLALARIRIEQQRFDEATRLLDELGASGGYRAPDAERLLDLVEGVSGN